ncbi:hypothetical protein LTR56_015483 [Elasticomyces elasticus]|nr:hypothetical protein LTR56_015483 [Elasticomyces elasticus]KAK3662516.1 hypothetical protein LTR22_006582 [Elasticomyces elasticus]KAK4927860.1 hypothetical protein LTR49_005282 [Elasticomyces elasticus]KAK5736677.1 hypothetical protein LTS12_026109 [Elasticomyces elasticus]
MAMVDLAKRSVRFTGVREVQICVENFEHSSRVLGLAEMLWVKVREWKAGVQAGRSEVGLEMELTFECHDQRISWNEKGVRQVEGLTRHLPEEDLGIEGLATAW